MRLITIYFLMHVFKYLLIKVLYEISFRFSQNGLYFVLIFEIEFSMTFPDKSIYVYTYIYIYIYINFKMNYNIR